MRASTEALVSRMADDVGMRTTYGIVWREGDGALARGKLELLATSVRFDGIVGTTHVTRELSYEELETVRVGRTRVERLNGHPTLVLTPFEGKPIALASVGQSSVIAELTSRLARTTLSP